MQEKLAKLKKALIEAFEGSEIIVDDVTFKKKGKFDFLTVTLDRVGGIDLDTIVEATKTVDKVVDKLDLIEDSYILDVESKERGAKDE